MKTTAFIGMLLLLCLPGCGGKERKAEEPPKAYSSIELGNRYYSTFEGGGLEYLSYPDYLGGTYHDSIGNLVFLVKGDREAAKKDVRRRIGDASNVRFEPCTYSLCELSELADKLGEQFKDLDLCEELGWTSIAISVVENRVYVFFKECTDSVIAKFKKTISDSEMIRFDKLIMEPLSIQADSVRTDSRAASINIHMGTKISVPPYSGSAGFRAKCGSDMGFVTAAHVAPTVNASCSFNGAVCGTVKKIASTTAGDASFIAVNTDVFFPTVYTAWTKTKLEKNYVAHSCLQRLTAVAEGTSTGKAINALVEFTNGSLNLDIGGSVKNITNLVYALYLNQNVRNEHGDSGCIVYMQGLINGQSVNNYVGGALCGSALGSENKYFMVFSSADKILNDLGAVLY